MSDRPSGDAAPVLPDVEGNPRPGPAPETGAVWNDVGDAPIPAHYGPSNPAPAAHQFGPGDEPALEAVIGRRGPRVAVSAVVALAQAVGLVALCVVAKFVIGIAVSWWGWIVLGVVLWATMMVPKLRRDLQLPGPVVAGARWVGTSPGRTVRFDELAHVELSNDQLPSPWWMLIDARGNHVMLNSGLIETQPELWALIHHGIRVGVANGAALDAKTHERLFGGGRVPDQPATRRARDGVT